MRLALHSSALLAVLFAQRPARASPEWNAGVITSLCALGEDQVYFDQLAWCNALHADLLFGRNRNSDFALGPYLEVSTRSFSDLRWGGGASLLVPVVEDFPWVISVGPYMNGLENPGISTSLFWGFRTYNFHGKYGMAGGLVVGADHDFGARAQNTLRVGLELDALWLALPFMLGYQWLRGG